MNKRAIISILVIIIIAVVVVLGFKEFLSYKKVSISFKQSAITIDIYSANKKKVASYSDNAVISLKEGQYYYIPTNEKFNSESVYFTVNSDETVEINPSFSPSYLLTLLKQQEDTIHNILTGAYPSLNSKYIIGDEKLSNHGEWYSAKLIQRVSGGNEPDVYRVVLENKNDTWSIIVKPRLIISAAEFPAVPKYVISQVNEPLSNAAYALLYPE